MRVLCSKHFLKTLPAGGSYRIREQPCYNENARHNIKPLLLDPLEHLTLQSRNLVQNVNHLTTGVRIAQNILLSKVTVGRKNDDVENHRDSSKELLESAGVRGLKKVQQHLDHLHDTLCFITPTSLEADLLKLMFEVRVWSCCIERGKVLGRLPQDGLERVEVLDAIIEHHSLALAVVGSEEVEERVHAVLVVEHFSREMPVEELHPVTNGLGEGWPGEGCGEGFKVQFQDEVAPVGAAINEFFFEVKILGNSELLNDEGVNIDPDILPNTRPETNGKGDPWREDDCFLCAFQNFIEGAVLEFALILLADLFKLRHQLVRLQYSFSMAFHPTNIHSFIYTSFFFQNRNRNKYIYIYLERTIRISLRWVARVESRRSRRL
ncbi:hypothetical protein Hanom_Chr12g01067671 [Helianthus anomalus]